LQTCPKCGHLFVASVPAEDAQVLWDEYKHRHNLVWKVLFQITTAAVILAAIPYLAGDSIGCKLGKWLLAAPVLAVVLVAFALGVINNELDLLGQIRTAHRGLQKAMFGMSRESPRSNYLWIFDQFFRPYRWFKAVTGLGDFRILVNFYLLALFATGGVMLVITAIYWFPVSNCSGS
jgi:hypothetical protein